MHPARSFVEPSPDPLPRPSSPLRLLLAGALGVGIGASLLVETAGEALDSDARETAHASCDRLICSHAR
eukprot:6196671-Pleurochrysis_carterae.AAC.1